jgi:glycosidase
MVRHGASVRRLPARLGSLLLVVSVLACGPAATPSPSGGPGGSAKPSAGNSVTAAAPTCPAGTPGSPEGGTTEARPWWADRVFYEVFVRSFQDSDGDGIGDLRGLTSRLDELNDGNPATTDDLGITGLWLMPVAESPSYHGYDVTDYRAIEKDYGTAQDFRALIAAAHERGIAVIVDLVMNHTSIEHPWFVDAVKRGSAHEDWYVWSETRPAIARSDGSRVWHEAGGRYYYAYFWEGMPDLNVRNPEVTAELDEIGAFWLSEMGVDGFRLDAARHLIEDGKQLENTPATFAWLSDFREKLKALREDALVLGEVWDATSMSSRYVREGSLDMTFDFGLAGATLTSVKSGDAGSVMAALGEVASSYPPGGAATFLTNHDQNRVATVLGQDLAAERLAAALLLTGPGVPFIYYGEEIGMTGAKPDERIRTPMRWDGSTPAAGFSTLAPWEDLSSDPPGVNVASEAADPSSLLSSYRNLIRLRSEHPALATGDWTKVKASSPAVAAFLRHVPGEDILVVANLGAVPLSGVSLDLKAGPLCGPQRANALGDDVVVATPTLNQRGGFDGYVPVEQLGGRAVLVIRLGA